MLKGVIHSRIGGKCLISCSTPFLLQDREGNRIEPNADGWYNLLPEKKYVISAV